MCKTIVMPRCCEAGFHNLTVMTDESTFGDIRIAKPTAASTVPIARTRCRSWQSVWAKPAVWFCATPTKTLYIAGDTVWRDAVAADLQNTSRMWWCLMPDTRM